MSLAFAKDTNAFSTAVEQLRREKVALTDENIEKRYNEIKGGKKVSEEPVVETPVEEVPEVVAEEPKTKSKKKK